MNFLDCFKSHILYFVLHFRESVLEHSLLIGLELLYVLLISIVLRLKSYNPLFFFFQLLEQELIHFDQIVNEHFFSFDLPVYLRHLLFEVKFFLLIRICCGLCDRSVGQVLIHQIVHLVISDHLVPNVSLAVH